MGSSIPETVDRYVYLVMEVNKEGIGGERHRKVDKGKTRRMKVK